MASGLHISQPSDPETQNRDTPAATVPASTTGNFLEFRPRRNPLLIVDTSEPLDEDDFIA